MPNVTKTVTFVFAGDGSLASEGLSVFLQTKPDFELIAECNDGESTIAEIEAHFPDIAVIDSQLPDLTAVQISGAVRTRNRMTKIIVLGSPEDRHSADQLIAAGADAFVMRNGPARHLNDAIRAVFDGRKYLAPQLPQKSEPATPQNEAIPGLRTVFEAQNRTVERLEEAMDRAKYAIERLAEDDRPAAAECAKAGAATAA